MAKWCQRRCLRNKIIRNNNGLWRPCLLTDRDERVIIIEDLHCCLLPSCGLFGQTISKEKTFKNRPIKNKTCLWGPCLVMDHCKMCSLCKESSRNVSYQVSVHLAQRFERKRLFKNKPIRKKNRPWQLCLLTDRDEMSNRYRRLAIDASY